ncbi:MAG: sporulation protein YunB, partial [Bacilli bacterium]
SYIKTKVSSYGINDVLMEIIVHVEVSQKMLLPTYADNVVIYQDIPIGYKMIKGQIPNYYFESGFSKDSNVLENKLLK